MIGGFEVPEQSDSVVQRADQQVWIFVPINIQTSRQRVPESPEPRRDPAAPDHLQRQKVRVRGRMYTLSAYSGVFAVRPGSVL